jgi:hypothetical protein
MIMSGSDYAQVLWATRSVRSAGQDHVRSLGWRAIGSDAEAQDSPGSKEGADGWVRTASQQPQTDDSVSRVGGFGNKA